MVGKKLKCLGYVEDFVTNWGKQRNSVEKKEKYLFRG